MERLWACGGPQTVRQVVDALPVERRRAYTTVMTVLDNLFHKGFVARELSQRAYTYWAIQTRAEHAAETMESALMNGGDRGAALMHFVDQLTAEEVAQLRGLLSTLEQ